MFSSELKKEISEFVQKKLQENNHPELPDDEISFLLHIDGKEPISWANIRNKKERSVPAPYILLRNMKLRPIE